MPARKPLTTAETSVRKYRDYSNQDAGAYKKFIEEMKEKMRSKDFKITQIEFDSLCSKYYWVNTLNITKFEQFNNNEMHPLYPVYKEIEANLEMLMLGCKDKIVSNTSHAVILDTLYQTGVKPLEVKDQPVAETSLPQSETSLDQAIIEQITKATKAAYRGLDAPQDADLRRQLKEASKAFEQDPTDEKLQDMIQILQETENKQCKKAFLTIIKELPAAAHHIQEIDARLTSTSVRPRS